jgi:hypothetical protein
MCSLQFAEPFCQLNHGKEAPVRRLQMGDSIVFYSPRERMEGGESLQAFTAAGRILDEVPYQVEQSKDFRPFRRMTQYFKSKVASIHPLLEELSFTKGRSNLGCCTLPRAFSDETRRLHEDRNSDGDHFQEECQLRTQPFYRADGLLRACPVEIHVSPCLIATSNQVF